MFYLNGKNIFIRFYNFNLQKWYFDKLFNSYLVLPVIRLSKNLFFYMDKGFLEIFGPLGLQRLVFFFSYYHRNYVLGEVSKSLSVRLVISRLKF